MKLINDILAILCLNNVKALPNFYLWYANCWELKGLEILSTRDFFEKLHLQGMNFLGASKQKNRNLSKLNHTLLCFLKG